MTAARPFHRPAQDRFTTPDGLSIAVYDLGGQGPDLLLVHATGFCAAVLGPLARHLGDRYHCWGLDLRAHGHSDRPTDGNFSWSGFATDVLTVIDGLGLERPAAFGHSCGGAAVLLAEQARPGTFSSLYLFEPVVMPPSLMDGDTRQVKENPLSIGARRRREVFPSAEDAWANFSSKPLFAALDTDVLRAYIDQGFGLVPVDDGGDGQAIRLLCRRNDEADVYASGFAHDAFEHLGEVECPVALACGEDTGVMGRPLVVADAGELPRSTVEVMSGLGHFGPMEQPKVVATSITRALSTVSDTPPS